MTTKKIKEEYNSLIKDIEKNFKNEEDIKYLQKRMPKLISVICNQVDGLEARLNEKEKEINTKMERIQNVVNHVESLIYEEFYADEEEAAFEIECPYCENDFYVDIDESRDEVKCPICNNVVELDWSGSIDTWGIQEYDDCEGGCSHCSGCDTNFALDEDEIDKLLEEDVESVEIDEDDDM